MSQNNFINSVWEENVAARFPFPVSRCPQKHKQFQLFGKREAGSGKREASVEMWKLFRTIPLFAENIVVMQVAGRKDFG
ncbi:hypothetical protein [Endozoicomonas sp. SESOKO1]|uniref:hypothetical protein n=1 Tax=Endozoicomonas sp. SESOKO1 TaxID=2828742 RepID=UPI00214927FD|nr:hypothetical protein [Endozoicomonas sp. SESOKO1]